MRPRLVLNCPNNNNTEVCALAHHLTPDELARASGMNRQEVIAKCLAAGVPILHGRIDRTLLESALRESIRSSPIPPRGLNEAVTKLERGADAPG